MKTLFSECKTGVLLTAVLVLACCGAYPVAVWACAQAAFPGRANGSLVTDETGAVRGSRLLGQDFSGEGYFHPRPSAAGSGYDAMNSGGSNFGPTSGKLALAIGGRVAAYRKENGLAGADPVPADAVTGSGSGLDPHISPANAALQASRVARARHLPPATVRSLIEASTEGRDWGVLGEPGVNVLLLNLALDRPAAAR